MGYWFFMLICILLCPVSMATGGWIMWKHTPKKINSLVGYRSMRSMKNEDTWQFANTHCGKRWWKLGILLLLPSLIPMLAVITARQETIGIVSIVIMSVQCTVMLLSILPTESALKRNFDADGKYIGQ